ncbi:U32 family peptidase [Geopsychrobacter electrodiphilus]|uniref:U32 family peptidase n=1 Tax=Geopsychrobacter electrodiphilus TaxID=225196 RepID=UPI00036AE449|nr:U32 family peptidase [Geopsychrobacter electrodiphilus]
MKLLAPLRNSSEVEPLLAAGAEEFYCGITPPAWQTRFSHNWINRRSPGSAGIDDFADLQRILLQAAGRPVYVTLNAPFYPAGSLELLVEFSAELLAAGVAGLIVADLNLLLSLVEAGLAAKIHLSSLATCTNQGAATFFQELGVSRVILPRHLTLDEIASSLVPGLDFEVFLLNDGCVFEEGLCATTHAAGAFCLNDGEAVPGISAQTLEGYAFWKWTLNHCGCKTNHGYPLGPCGLCALPRLRHMGISSLKVVGREASLPRKQAAVSLAAQALRLARSGAGPEEIRDRVIELRGGAALCQGRHLCYYPEVWAAAQSGEGRC